MGQALLGPGRADGAHRQGAQPGCSGGALRAVSVAGTTARPSSWIQVHLRVYLSSRGCSQQHKEHESSLGGAPLQS